MKLLQNTFEFTGFKTFTGNEGPGFNANLIWNGVKVAFVRDDASGGDHIIKWVRKPQTNYKAQFNELLLALPGPLDPGWAVLEQRRKDDTDEQYKFHLISMRESQLFDLLFNETLALKSLKRRAKKSLLYRTPDQLPNAYWVVSNRTYGEPAVRHLITKHPGCEVFDGTAWISMDTARQAFGL